MRAIALLVLGACSAPPATPPVLEDLELPEGERFTLHPPVVAQGTDVVLTLDSLRSSLRFDATELSLEADGLTLSDFAVLDGFTASAELTIADDAPIGPLDAILTIQGDPIVLGDALTILADRFVAEPGEARMGEVINVTLTGVGTEWSDLDTWVGFGTDVQTLAVDVHGPTSLTARVAIASDARPGYRDITVEQGGGALTLYDGFLVDRAVITASFDPPTVEQGAEVDVVIEGVNTRFPEDFGPEQIQFWRNTAAIADLTFESFERVSETRLEGRAKVSNAATPGFRDVYVDGIDDLLIQDAFEVIAVEPDPLDAYIARVFDVRRTIGPDGSVSDDVRAFVWFVIPLDPPCVSVPSIADGPVPFDIAGVFPQPDPTAVVDCPEPLTVSAGDLVTFESPTNVVTLHKEIVGSTGQILYRGRDLTLADYHFGQTYDLRATGDPEGIPAFTVEDAQPTVPNDVQLLAPSFGGLVHDRFEPFEMEWTNAGVYPTGFFSLSMTGSLEATGTSGMLAVLPFDDGRFVFGADHVSQLAAGDVQFQAVSAVEGRIWTWPYNGRNHQGDSSLVINATLELQ